MIEWVLDLVVALNLWHSEFLWQGIGIDGYNERRVSSVYQIVKVAGDSSLEGVHHDLHLFLHLRENRWRCCIHERRHAQVPPLRSTGLVTAFWPLKSPSFRAVPLVFLLDVVSCVPLSQLLLQIMVLFHEALYCSREGLDLSF